MKRNFIPSHKSDLDACEILRNTDFKVVKEFAVELLEWVQDINWPVAASVAAYLSPHSAELSDEIIEILNGNDEVWKYWIILHILDNELLSEYPKKLITALEKIAYSPSYSEWEEEVDEAAQYFLEFFDPGPDDITSIQFEFEWEENSGEDNRKIFLETLESFIIDFEKVQHFKLKSDKGKIKAEHSAALRLCKGYLIKTVENLIREIPNTLKRLKSRYE